MGWIESHSAVTSTTKFGLRKLSFVFFPQAPILGQDQINGLTAGPFAEAPRFADAHAVSNTATTPARAL